MSTQIKEVMAEDVKYIQTYKAVSGYWRVKVNGVVDPRLVGFEKQSDIVAKTLLLYPNGMSLRNMALAIEESKDNYPGKQKLEDTLAGGIKEGEILVMGKLHG